MLFLLLRKKSGGGRRERELNLSTHLLEVFDGCRDEEEGSIVVVDGRKGSREESRLFLGTQIDSPGKHELSQSSREIGYLLIG